MAQFVEEELKQIILRNLTMRITADEITDESDLVRDFVLDSLQMIRLVMDLEDHFSICIRNEELLVDLISKYKSLKEYIMNRAS